MTPCLYLEFSGVTLKGGILSAWQNQTDALRSVGVNVVTNPRQPHDLLHLYLPLLRSRFLAATEHLRKRPLVTHVHVTAEDFKNSFRGSNMITPFLRWWLKTYYRTGDVVLTPTEYTRKLIIDWYDLHPEKVIAISNGIHVSEFLPNQKLRDEYRKKYNLTGVSVYSLGWVFPRKGIYTFADVARKFPHTPFIWWGQKTPDFMRHMPREMETAANTNFSGFIDKASGGINAGDIFFFPSYEENQGIVVLEAAANAKAILLRDIPVYEGWMIHGQNCFKAKTDEEFAHYLAMLLHDKTLRTRLGDKAQQMAKEHDLPIIGKKLSGIYQSVLQAHHAA